MSSVSQVIAVQLFDGGILAPLITSLAVCAIPIVAILTRHQRHMAEIIHGRRHDDVLRSELEGVKAEVAELRGQLRALTPSSGASGEAEALARRLG